MSRLTRFLYLATLAFIPWAALLPFPWIHENARWSDALFALATLAWALGLASERRLPQLRPLHAGLVLYVGWAAVYLASDESRWITGQVLVVDAGLTLTTRGDQVLTREPQ